MKGFAVDSAKRLHDMSAMVEQLCIQLQQALPKGDYDVLTKGKLHDAGTLKISRVNAFLESILRLHFFLLVSFRRLILPLCPSCFRLLSGGQKLHSVCLLLEPYLYHTLMFIAPVSSV